MRVSWRFEGDFDEIFTGSRRWDSRTMPDPYSGPERCRCGKGETEATDNG
jgi:hypothetical protein